MTEFQRVTANDLIGTHSPKQLALALNSYGVGVSFYPAEEAISNIAVVSLGVVRAPLVENKARIIARFSRGLVPGEMISSLYNSVKADGAVTQIPSALFTSAMITKAGEYVLQAGLDVTGLEPGDVLMGNISHIAEPEMPNLFFNIIVQTF